MASHPRPTPDPQCQDLRGVHEAARETLTCVHNYLIRSRGDLGDPLSSDWRPHLARVISRGPGDNLTALPTPYNEPEGPCDAYSARSPAMEEMASPAPPAGPTPRDEKRRSGAWLCGANEPSLDFQSRRLQIFYLLPRRPL